MRIMMGFTEDNGGKQCRDNGGGDGGEHLCLEISMKQRLEFR